MAARARNNVDNESCDALSSVSTGIDLESHCVVALFEKFGL